MILNKNKHDLSPRFLSEIIYSLAKIKFFSLEIYERISKTIVKNVNQLNIQDSI